MAELLAALHAGLQKGEAKAKRAGDRQPAATSGQAEAVKLNLRVWGGSSDAIRPDTEENPFAEEAEAKPAEPPEDDPFVERPDKEG
ncbi:unnamed protein product [marine sediment metagenome]|uniref:Uncharacterized protein n=1 Tax=marine sediment metagenome TaxID=412755 RepID=X0X4H1_9ZZZZ